MPDDENRDLSFGRDKRLIKPADYRRVFNAPLIKAHHKYAMVLAVPNGQAHGRLGLVVAKKHAKLAVQRNRIKRLTREFFRKTGQDSSLDCVFLCKPGIIDLTNAELTTVLDVLWSKLLGSLHKISGTPRDSHDDPR